MYCQSLPQWRCYCMRVHVYIYNILLYEDKSHSPGGSKYARIMSLYISIYIYRYLRYRVTSARRKGYIGESFSGEIFSPRGWFLARRGVLSLDEQ